MHVQSKSVLSDKSFWLGLLPPFGLGAVAWWVGTRFPVLGAPVVGIILGLIVGQVVGQPRILSAGTKFCSKKVLQTSIVLLGLGISLQDVARIGGAGLPVMVGTIVVALAVGIPLSRRLKVERETRILVTYGTCICGASAIATMSQVIGASASAVAVSIAVIVFYNVLAAIVFPYLGQAAGFSAQTFGLWAGTAVNDTSSVVAAATSYDALLVAAGMTGGLAAAYAVVVKLTRTLAIIPLAVFQTWFGNRAKPVDERAQTAWYRLIPPFLGFFLVAAAIRTSGIIPDAWDATIKFLAHFGTTVAMAAVGMTSSLSAIRKAGWRPLALGAILWLLIGGTSLLLQWVTGQLTFLP